MSNSNEYMRKYMLKRYYKRRREWIDKLGGACVVCGTVKDLEFDHKDASTKTQAIGKILTSGSNERVAKEMQKCQLLCNKHHKEKTIASGDSRAVAHGGGKAGKRNCKCELCRLKKNKYLKEYKRNKKYTPVAQ